MIITIYNRLVGCVCVCVTKSWFSQATVKSRRDIRFLQDQSRQEVTVRMMRSLKAEWKPSRPTPDGATRKSLLSERDVRQRIPGERDELENAEQQTEPFSLPLRCTTIDSYYGARTRTRDLTTSAETMVSAMNS